MTTATSLLETAATWKESRGRVVIGGGPRVGKSYLAARLEEIGLQVEHTDDLIGSLEWSALSEFVAKHTMASPGPWCLEGTATVRCLRKAMAMRPGRPCDLLVWMRGPRVDLTSGQSGMYKGCEKIFREIRPELELRGVEIMVIG